MNVLIPLIPLLLAQAAPPPATPTPPPADTLQSPEVHADGRVTFRLSAPSAREVAVAGEWIRPQAAVNTPEKMTKDQKGVWSITVGPLEPNIYIYVFNVDGMTVTDPVNPQVKLRARTNASMVEIPGGRPWEFRDVPHGSLETFTHASSVLGGAMRQVVVYTPPGYNKNRSTRYPILYLLHGSNDLAVGWTMAGRANLILDNFIAAKQAVPMIVVMPWGHALPFGARPAAGQPNNSDLFEQYLLKDVIPLVEPKFRLAAGRRNRAIVGLSMGGNQALQVGLHHRDLFSAIGVFGNGLNRADFDTRYKDAMTGAPARHKLGMVFIGIAKEDPAYARAKELNEALRSYGLQPTYHETVGGHTYPVWRKLLVETLPLLFQGKELASTTAGP